VDKIDKMDKIVNNALKGQNNSAWGIALRNRTNNRKHKSFIK